MLLLQVKLPLGKVDTVGQAAALAKLQKEFGIASNSLTSIGTSTANSQLIEGKKYTDKNGITKTYRNGKFE